MLRFRKRLTSRAGKRIGSRPIIFYFSWALYAFAGLCITVAVVVAAMAVGLIQVPAEVGPTFLLGSVLSLAFSAFAMAVAQGVRQIGVFYDDSYLYVTSPLAAPLLPVDTSPSSRMLIRDVKGTTVVKDGLGRFHVHVEADEGVALKFPVALCVVGNSTKPKASRVAAAVEQIAGLDA